MNKQLIITEKPSVSRSIAAALGVSQKREGYIEGNDYLISWCAGHLLELAAPDAYGEQYAQWRYEDLPIVPNVWKHIVTKDKAAQVKILKELMNRSEVECVVNACDAGREGENIFRLVYEYAKCKKPIRRLWISSMEESAIKTGFAALKDGSEYDNLYAAASCRECADWLVGISTTRLFSVLYGSTLNTGRVQSPTLAMLVRREADIASFISEPFYTPVINCGFSASGEKLKDCDAAEAVRADCDGRDATVTAVERQTKTTAPPKLFDLTTLQREANRLFGFTAAQTLEYVQSMYERAIVSYPRTDSRYLTGDMLDTANMLVKWLMTKMPYMDGNTFTPDINRLVNDKEVTDHHAIIPTPEIINSDLTKLPSGEIDILNLIMLRLLCAAAPVHSFESVTAKLTCGGHDFTAKGKTVISDGWKAIDGAYRAALKTKPDKDDERSSQDDDDSVALLDLSEGQVFKEVSASIKEGATTPPKHFTEDTLLAAMESAGAEDMPEDAERKGLGTPATRAAIIEKIIKSGFVERQKKNMIPTDKGKNLIAVLPNALTSAKMTAEWEHKLKKVEHGELSAKTFMDNIAAFMKSIVLDNKAPKPEFIGLFPGAKKPVGASVGVCPRCGSPVREGIKGFFCDKSDCGFKLWKASKFFESKKKALTAPIVAALLKDGRVAMKGLYSEKTGKTYDAVVLLDDDGGKFINFKLEFKGDKK